MIESRTGNMRKGLLDLIAYIGRTHKTKELTIIEVGSYKGDSARIFARYFKHVYCVDAWEQATFNVPNTNVQEAEREFDKAVRECGNITKIKGRSLDIAKTFGIDCDVIYIDASHDYANVLADIRAWRSKARLFVCGHDYWPKKFPGVIRAVNEIYVKPDRIFIDTSWLVRK